MRQSNMDVGAVSNGRAAFEAVRSRRADPEPGPILAVRTGLAPLSAFTGGEPLEEDLLRSALRHRSLLLDLDPVLSQPTDEPEREPAREPAEDSAASEPAEN